MACLYWERSRHCCILHLLDGGSSLQAMNANWQACNLTDPSRSPNESMPALQRSKTCKHTLSYTPGPWMLSWLGRATRCCTS